MASTKTISNTFSVSALENAFAVDLSNEMDSVACDNSMKTISAFNIYSMISAFDGVRENTSTCRVRYVSRPSNCTTFLESSGSGTGSTALTTSFQTIGSNKYIRIHYNSGVSVNKKDTLKIEVTHDGLGTLTLDITISATKGGAIYNVVPSVTTISKNPNGTVSYSPSSISAYISKHDIESGVTSDNPSEATLKYSADGGSIQNYSSALTPGTHFSSYVTFYVQVGGAYVDKETVSIVLDGADSTVPGPRGSEGYGIKLTLERSGKYLESTWNTCGTIGHSEPWGKISGDSDFTACRVGDYFIVTGTSTDKGIRHTIEYRCTSVSADSITGTCVSHVKDGLEGSRGRIGRFFYYVGTWTGDTTKTYIVNDAQAPYFKYGSNYYVFNPETNGNYTESQMGTPSSSSDNWEIMTNDFKYIITEAIFGSFAHFGSFIISEDWLICENGTIDGQAYTAGDTYANYPAYMFFDPQYPMGTRNLGINNLSVTGTAAIQKGSSFALKGKRVVKVTGKVTSGTMYVALCFAGGSAISSPEAIKSTSSQSVTIDFISDSEASVCIKAYMSSSSSSVVGTILSVTVETFAPTFAVDGLSGKSIQNNTVVRGSIYTPYFQISSSNIGSYSTTKHDDTYDFDYQELDIGRTGLNLQISAPTSPILYVSLPAEEKYLGAQANVMCTDYYVVMRGISRVLGSGVSVSYDTYNPMIYKGQKMQFKCIYDGGYKWVIDAIQDYMIPTQPSLIAFGETSLFYMSGEWSVMRTKSYGIDFTITRQSAGKYRVTRPTNCAISMTDPDVLITVYGKGYVFSSGGSQVDGHPCKATLLSPSSATYFEVVTSDDDTMNDGEFGFTVHYAGRINTYTI